MEKQKKTIYTLALRGYAPDLLNLTFPLMKKYAAKIEAEFVVIEDLKFPDLYPTYEKFQIWDLMKERGDDWSIFFDADTLIHPDFFDVTTLINKDTTCSGYASDFTPLRFRPDHYFMRDGRYLGKGTWFIICSDWTRDIWHPLEDISYQEAVENIFPINDEVVTIKKTKESLIDDYVVSRNIARYSLKHTVITEICERYKIAVGVPANLPGPGGQVQQVISPYLQHDYRRPLAEKMIWAEKVLQGWAVTI